MSNVIGKPELIVIDSVWKELDGLSRGMRGLLLGLLKRRSEMMDDPPGEKHTDMMLLRLSKMNNWPVLTVDTRLKEILSEAGCSYIEVVADRMLRLGD